ncbi:L-threo-3-hydroxyaspartate ammonia-lyase [Commensalibacter sp. Nvir]|uniref:threo-3-hydroxy-L-aspartate ammonia-lyase n=1 Tax=Commensalibacter sp. Nvir TaxID=3069817 RepID=UPI002D458E1C|nr:L-threo-3-hydroxyaspartate ammonia-lyase [Commensalibacter sp. Nvir]
MKFCTSYEDIVQASNILKTKAVQTPVFTSRTANQLSNATLYFKCENYQHVGAFKFRGAFNAIAKLSEDQKKRGVIAYSSGNHAQAVAYASKLHNIPALIVMPYDAPKIKMAATKEYGAEIYHYDRYTENRETIAKTIADDRGLTLIPPYDHPDVIAGQGTCAKELIEEVGELDYLFVPLGGGGLLAGSLLSAKHLLPSIRVIGIEPEAGNDVQQSLKKGEIVEIPTPKSIADGAVTTHVGYHNFEIIRHYVNDIITVPDKPLIEMMKFFAERMKMIVEPTGCLAAAAVMEKYLPVRQKKIGIIVSGGNVDMQQFAYWMG